MIIISVLGFILYNLGNWVLDTWGLLSIDEIIFHLKVPLDGTNSDVVLDGINACVPLAVLVLFLSDLYVEPSIFLNTNDVDIIKVVIDNNNVIMNINRPLATKNSINGDL
mgnify:CR=1 FL=1